MQPLPEPQPLVSLIDATVDVSEFCRVVGVRRRTAYNYIRDGLIPSIRVGRAIRIRRDVVEKVLRDGIHRRVL